jgi:hypothetical protein
MKPAADGAKRVNGKRIGCSDRDYYSRLLRMAAQGDDAALKQGVLVGVASGKCTVFEDQDPVFIADSAVFAGLVKLRRQGEMAEYWAPIESIQ